MKKFADYEDEKSQSYYSFLRQILITSTTLLGILISFYDKGATESLNQVLFSISIVSCAIGILTLLYLLFSEVRLLKSIQNQILEELTRLVDIEYSPKTENIFEGKDSRFVKLIGFIAVVSFVLFLVCLVLYVVV